MLVEQGGDGSVGRGVLAQAPGWSGRGRPHSRGLEEPQVLVDLVQSR